MREDEAETRVVASPEVIEARRRMLAARLDARTSGKYARILLAALSGVPWIGSLLSAAATYSSEIEQEQQSELHRLWIQEHEERLRRLSQDLGDIVARFEDLGEEVQERVQSDEYLGLVRRAFRSWDQAETDQKRDFIRKMIANAGGTRLCPDDLIRLFIAWIDLYHESHFAVIACVYQRPGVTRGGIWRVVNGKNVREDSAEADLFRYLVRDLSTGGVIRQHRETNYQGEFVRKTTVHTPKGRAPSTMKSAFDETEGYELTELGRQFLHYTMDELVTRVQG